LASAGRAFFFPAGKTRREFNMSLWLPYKKSGKWQLIVVPTHCALGVLSIFCWLLGTIVLTAVVIVRSCLAG
jgi:hypothetical protein